MQTSSKLPLYEAIFLLALKDEKGTPFTSINYKHAMGAAILAELIIKEIFVVEKVKKRNYLQLPKLVKTGDEILDECITKVAQAKRRAQLQVWVQRFSGLKRLKQRTAAQLCKKNILKEKEEKVLLFFKQKTYPELNHRPEARIIQQLEKAIFGTSNEIDPEILVLVSICQATHLLPKLFDKQRLKKQKTRIKKITDGELVGKATKEAIEAMQAAIMVAVIIPAATSAAVS